VARSSSGLQRNGERFSARETSSTPRASSRIKGPARVSEMISAQTRSRRVRRLRATRRGRQARSFTAGSTPAAKRGSTRGWLLSALETVAVETPAARSPSKMVIMVARCCSPHLATHRDFGRPHRALRRLDVDRSEGTRLPVGTGRRSARGGHLARDRTLVQTMGVLVSKILRRRG
jgi:hypothetical protein